MVNLIKEGDMKYVIEIEEDELETLRKNTFISTCLAGFCDPTMCDKHQIEENLILVSDLLSDICILLNKFKKGE